MSNVGQIQNVDGRWTVTFDGRKVMSAKGELGWAKSNLRRNVKASKLGLRVFNVVDESGKVLEVFSLDDNGRKPNADKPKPVRKVAVVNQEVPEDERILRIVGQVGSKMEGYERQGVLKERNGRVLIVEFTSRRDGGIKINYEFDAKTGVQITHNPYHIWQIADLAEAI